MIGGDSVLGYLLSPFIFLVPLAALAWLRRDWAVFALLTLLPTYLRRTSLWGIPTTWFELALYVVCLSYLLHGDLKRMRLAAVPTPLVFSVVLWLGAACLGLLISPHIRLSLGIFKGWIIDPLLTVGLLWQVGQGAIDLTKFVRNVVGALLLGAAATSAWALFSSLDQGAQRLGAWYDSPNVLAMYLVPVAVVTLLWLFFNVKPWRWGLVQNWWYVGVLAVLLATLGTGSYGAWLALAVGLTVGLLYHRLTWRRAARACAALVVLVGLALPWVVVPTGYWPLPGHRNTEYDVTSGQVRLVLWREATRLVSIHPTLGVGLGQWQLIFDHQISPYLPEVRQPGYAIELHYASLFPHNLWLATWLSMGLLGLLAVVYLCWYVYQIGRPWNSYTPLAAGMLTAVLVQGWFDTPVFKNDLAILFWLPAVLIAVVKGTAAKLD